jgi:DNA polymerase III delta prime subunit
MFILIGLAGPAGVGKTTAAALLAQAVGCPVLGFADPIRETVLRLVPSWGKWHLEDGKDHKRRDAPFAPRHAMQVIGDHARSLQWDIYIRAMERRLAGHKDEGAPGAVVHDLRTQAEAIWLREEGGVLVHLQREGVAFRGDHATEMGVSAAPEDLVIHNPGTLEGLRAELQVGLVDVWRLGM